MGNLSLSDFDDSKIIDEVQIFHKRVFDAVHLLESFEAEKSSLEDNLIKQHLKLNFLTQIGDQTTTEVIFSYLQLFFK